MAGTRPLRTGWLRLSLGAVLEIIGITILGWQEQNIFAISQEATLPAFAATIVGVVLAGSGWVRAVGSLAGRRKHWAGVAGALAGGVLLLGALSWQLTIGLTPSGNLNLDVYAALSLFFFGVVVVAGSASALRHGGDVPSTPPAPHDSWRLAPVSSAGLLGLGLGLLVVPVAASGWFDTRTAVNSLYQIAVLELSAGGLCLALAGYRSLQRTVSLPRAAPVQRWGEVAGIVLILAGPIWWWRTAPLIYALGWIVLGGLVLAGAGLLVLGIRAPPPE